MICLIKFDFYNPSCMLQLSKFVWTIPYSVQVVFNNFLLRNSTDRSKGSSNEKRLLFAVSLHTLSCFANTPFKIRNKTYISCFQTSSVQNQKSLRHWIKLL